MRNIRFLTVIIIIVSVLNALGSRFIPLPTGGPNYEAFSTVLPFYMFNVSLNIGAVILFLYGLAGFKTAFRRTYYRISAGLAVQSIGTLVYLGALFLGLYGQSNYATLWAEIPLAAGNIIIFSGLISFCRLLRINTWITRRSLVAIITVIVLTAVVLAPHRPSEGGGDEIIFAIGHALLALETLFYLFIAIATRQNRLIASRVYTPSLNWFFYAAIVAFIADTLLLGYDYLVYPSWLSLDAINLGFIATNLMSVFAANAFSNITRITYQASQGNTLIDAIVLLASFASNPREIESTLNEFRAITAQRQAGARLTPSEHQILTGIAYELKEYLIKKEQIRSFRRQDLNDLLQERYNIIIPDAIHK